MHVAVLHLFLLKLPMTRRKSSKKANFSDLPQATETSQATQSTGGTQTDIIIPKDIHANAVLVTAYFTEKFTAHQFYVPPKLSIAELRDAVNRELDVHVTKEWGLLEDVLYPDKEVIVFSSGETNLQIHLPSLRPNEMHLYQMGKGATDSMTTKN